MKERNIYICEKCGLEIEEDYKAMLDHENDDHIEPKGYQQPKPIQYFSGNQGRYPNLITVEMRDGVIVEYTFRGVLQKETPLPETEGNQEKI